LFAPITGSVTDFVPFNKVDLLPLLQEKELIPIVLMN
jgi:hypothetical protein